MYSLVPEEVSLAPTFVSSVFVAFVWSWAIEILPEVSDMWLLESKTAGDLFVLVVCHSLEHIEVPWELSSHLKDSVCLESSKALVECCTWVDSSKPRWWLVLAVAQKIDLMAWMGLAFESLYLFGV